MSLESQLKRLERKTGINDACGEWNLTLLTDEELLGLEACFSKAEATGAPVQWHITPELEAALQRVAR